MCGIEELDYAYMTSGRFYHLDITYFSPSPFYGGSEPNYTGYTVYEAPEEPTPKPVNFVETKKPTKQPIKTYRKKSNRQGNVHGGWLKRF
jgi:hypothetical protein